MNLARNLHQPTTYWPPAGKDGFGKTQLGAPQAVLGRWEEKVELVSNGGGETLTTKEQVFLEIEVAVQGYLYKGTSVATDPREVPNSNEIIYVTRIPDLRNLQVLKVALV